MSEEIVKTDEKDEAPKRLEGRGPHVIYDKQTRLFWLKKDSWQDKGKFFNWHESRDYTDNKNQRKIGGFDDWRMPTADEAATLFDANLSNPGKAGVTLHIDPIFPEGSFKVHWLAGDTSTRRPRYDCAEGKVVVADEYSFGAIRPVRKEPVRKEGATMRRR